MRQAIMWVVLVVVLCVSASAQEGPRLVPVGPPEYYVVPRAVPYQRYAVVAPPGSIVYYPPPRPRYVAGVWPLPFYWYVY